MIQQFYLTKGSIHDAIKFYTSKPDLIVMSKTGSLLWTNAEYVCEIWFLQRLFPNLDMLPGQCMLVEITSEEDKSTSMRIVNADIKPGKVISG